MCFAETSAGSEGIDAEERLRNDEKRLYDAIIADLTAGKPLVVTTFVNLTYNGECPPLDRNMYWGQRYGYRSFFTVEQRKNEYCKRFPGLRFSLVYSEKRKEDPVEVLIFKALAQPKGRLAAAIGNKPVNLYVVNLAWRDGWSALKAIVNAALQGRGDFVFSTTDGATINAIADARLIGMAGHNPLFDGIVSIDSCKPAIESERTVGVFAIGCYTGLEFMHEAVAIYPHLAQGPAVPVLFTNAFMAGSAYSLVGMVAAILEGRTLDQIARRANDEYQYFGSLNGKKTGRPFMKPSKLYR